MKYSLVALAVLGLGASAAQAQEVVRIGATAPLTGTQAHLGKDIENGVRLALVITAHGFALSTLWGWFVVPFFQAPPLPLAMASVTRSR